jgi:hypothetical protein
MHALAALLFTLNVSTTAPACPNLSGDYVIGGKDGRVRVSIAQKGCQKIAISWTSTLTPPTARVEHALTLNGAFHADSGWYGATEEQMTAASFHQGVLEISEKPRGAEPADPIAWTLRLEKLANGDLCTKFVQGTVGITSLAAKRIGKTQAAEDVSAKRSDAGCTIH